MFHDCGDDLYAIPRTRRGYCRARKFFLKRGLACCRPYCDALDSLGLAARVVRCDKRESEGPSLDWLIDQHFEHDLHGGESWSGVRQYKIEESIEPGLFLIFRYLGLGGHG